MPLHFEAAFPQKAVPAEGFRAKKQWEAALEALVWLRANLDEAGRKEQPLLVLGDGDFSVAELRAALPEEGVVLMSRCPRTGRPTSCQQEHPGRRRDGAAEGVSTEIGRRDPSSG